VAFRCEEGNAFVFTEETESEASEIRQYSCTEQFIEQLVSNDKDFDTLRRYPIQISAGSLITRLSFFVAFFSPLDKFRSDISN
jgi:hypothetical protein